MKRVLTALIGFALSLSMASCVQLEDTPSVDILENPIAADLTIYYSPTAGEIEGQDAESGTMYTLACIEGEPALGTHPDREIACRNLIRSYNDMAALLSSGYDMCTTIYGGPEEARIVGTLNMKQLDFYLTKTNGCEIAKWAAWEPVMLSIQEGYLNVSPSE